MDFVLLVPEMPVRRGPSMALSAHTYSIWAMYTIMYRVAALAPSGQRSPATRSNMRRRIRRED